MDQTSGAHNWSQGTAANRPAVATAGPNGRTCADFDGSNDSLVNAAISNFVTASAGYMAVSFIADTIVTNNVNLWTNHGIATDGAGGIFGLYIRNTDATPGNPDTVDAFNWDGASKAASSASIIAGTAYVVEWKRASGTTTSVRVNGGSWIDAAAGNLTSLTGLFTLGTGNGTSAGSLDGKIFELITFSTVPTSGQQDALAANMKTYIGA